MPATLNEDKLHELLGTMVGELGAAVNALLVSIGDRLGLYRALAAHGPSTAEELARATGTHERYVREWLAAQAASGFVEYDAESRRFSLTPEQSAVFADEDSPVYMCGGFEGLPAIFSTRDRLAEIYRTGEGLGWEDHDADLFLGTEKFFRPSYRAHLLESWIPALDGIERTLEHGGTAADVGCGHGASTLILAEAYPNTEFVGFDFHEPSIERARHLASQKGLGNVRFEVATAKEYPGEGYDLVAFFDCLHDMGDPVGAARHVRETLAADGSWLLVEPFANDTLEENLNPVGRVYYAFSSAICTPCSRSQEVGAALGAQAGEGRLRRVAEEAGFTRFRRAAETPFNLILEAKP